MEDLNKIEKEFIALLRIISDKDVPKDVKRMIFPRAVRVAQKVLDEVLSEVAEEIGELEEAIQ